MLTTKIKDVLMSLRSDFNKSNREIANAIGVNEAHLSNVYGARKEGSDQMLKALELYKHKLEHPDWVWQSEEEKAKAVRRAKAIGVGLDDFVVHCAMRYGAEVMDELLHSSPPKDQKPAIDMFSSDQGEAGISSSEKNAVKLGGESGSGISDGQKSSVSKRKQIRRRSS